MVPRRWSAAEVFFGLTTPDVNNAQSRLRQKKNDYPGPKKASSYGSSEVSALTTIPVVDTAFLEQKFRARLDLHPGESNSDDRDVDDLNPLHDDGVTLLTKPMSESKFSFSENSDKTFCSRSDRRGVVSTTMAATENHNS